MIEGKRHQYTQKEREEVLQGVASVLREEQTVRFAFVHGSFLLREIAFRDVDVAVYLADCVPREERLDRCLGLQVALEWAISLPFDVHALNDAPLGLVYDAVNGRAVFFRDKEECLTFAERKRMQYWDFRHLQRQIIDDLFSSGDAPDRGEAGGGGR